jgi:hypothetical protein
MDPIHPIRPTSEQPAAVDAIRHVTRAGEDPRPEQRSPRGRRRRPAAPASPPRVDADGHLDVRA